MRTILKCCPFCGGAPAYLFDTAIELSEGKKVDGEHSFIFCIECSAVMTGETPEEAIKKWNRRK